MRIQILAIGKMKKNSPEKQIIDDYIQKTLWPIEIHEAEEHRPLSSVQIKEAEGKLLEKMIPKGAKIVVLDEKGKELNSHEFSEQIEHWKDQSVSDIVFLIGGAFGHSSEIKQKADLLLSFGRMTLPHMLMRAVLTEQIYRAFTLSEGHPYHKD